MVASLIFIVIVGLHLAPGISGAKIGIEGTKVTQPPVVGDQDESISMYKKQDVHNIIRNHYCIGAEDGKLVQDSNDCTKYYVCDGVGHATQTSHSCEDNHGGCFDPITGNCTQVEATCEQLCKPKCKKACSKFGDHIADSTNSSKYYFCLGNDSKPNITHHCPPERKYFNGIKCVSYMSQSCTCQPRQEKCEINGQQIPDPNDCHAYYLCNGIEDVFSLDGPHYCKPGKSFVNGTCMALDTDCTNICEPDPTMVTSPHDDDESTSNIVSPSDDNECEDIWYPTNDYNYTCSDYRRGCTDRYVSYYEWMQAECKKTCGLCDQGPSNVISPSDDGKCQDNWNPLSNSIRKCGSFRRACTDRYHEKYKWVQIECKKTCGLCNQGSRPDECNDRESRAYCEKYKRDCYWDSDVTENCRLTCNVCDDLEYTESGPGRCKDRGPRAYCEANKRKCQYYSSIRENCKLTCNMCEDLVGGDIYYPNHDNNAHGNNYYNSYNYGYL